MTPGPSENPDFSYSELVQQNKALRLEIDRLKAERSVLSKLLVEASRRMQMPVTAIKAAVSSLLDHDIFWGEASQYEFLKTIDSSVDQSAKYVALLSLAFRTEAGELELKHEPQSLLEILNTIQVRVARQLPGLVLEIEFPNDDSPVLVDYEYTLIALNLLFEICEAEMGSCKIYLRAAESPDHWSLYLEGIDLSIINHLMLKAAKDQVGMASWENNLKLNVISRILHLQAIRAQLAESPDGKPLFVLLIPKQLSKNGKQ